MKQIKFSDLKIHLIALIIFIVILGFYFFTQTGEEIKILNKALSYAGIFLGSIVFLLGPLSRFYPKTFSQNLKSRKPLGLWSFVFILIHFFISMDLYYKWSFSALFNFSNPFGIAFTAALISFVILALMSLTSTIGAMKTLGYKNWKMLQTTGYIALLLAVVHYSFLPKKIFANSMHGMILTLIVVLALILKIYSLFRGVKKHKHHFEEKK